MRKLSTVKKLALVVTAGVLATGSLTACLPSVDKADAKPSATSSAAGAKKPSASASSDSKDMLTKNIEIGKVDIEHRDGYETHVRFPVTNKNKTFVDVRYTLTFTSNAKSDSYGERETENATATDAAPPAWYSDHHLVQRSFCTYLFSGETCNVDLVIRIPTRYEYANGTDINSYTSSFTDIDVSVNATEMLDSDLWFDCTNGLTSKISYIDINNTQTVWHITTSYFFTNETNHYIKELHFRDNYGTDDVSDIFDLDGEVFSKRLDYSAHYVPSSNKDSYNELSGPYKGATSKKAGFESKYFDYDYTDSLHFGPGEVRIPFSPPGDSWFPKEVAPVNSTAITPEWIQWHQEHWQRRAYCLIDATKK